MRTMEEQLARDQRSLRSVDADVARILSLLAIAAPAGAFLELGSSGGYSSLWLSLAARIKGVKLTTVDLDGSTQCSCRFPRAISSAGSAEAR